MRIVLCALALCGALNGFVCAQESVRPEVTALLARMPPFLRTLKLPPVIWHDLPAGTARGGEKSDLGLELWVPKGADMADIFCHELAHIQQDRHPAMARRFLEFRHDQPATQEKIGQIWLAVMRANNGELEPPYRLDGAAWAAINELKFPRRRADDLHALTKSIEYWAVSVELAFLAWKNGDMKRLGAHLSEEEAAFLAPLFP